VEEEEYPWFGGRQASGEELGGGEDLFVGAAVEGESVPVSAHEYGVSGAPILFGTEENQLLSTIFAREDDLLLERTLHEFTSSALSGLAFMNYYWASGWPALRGATSHIHGVATRSTKLR
jgi:hypothetical protein